MNSKDRSLCINFLLKVAHRSNADAKRLVRTLGPGESALLLEHAREWKASGYPVKGVDGSWHSVTPPEPLPAVNSVSEATPLEHVKNPPPEGSPVASKQKKVMYSILLPPSDLESMRAISDSTGEAVAFHVRSAIRRYIKAAERGEL